MRTPLLVLGPAFSIICMFLIGLSCSSWVQRVVSITGSGRKRYRRGAGTLTGRWLVSLVSWSGLWTLGGAFRFCCCCPPRWCPLRWCLWWFVSLGGWGVGPCCTFSPLARLTPLAMLLETVESVTFLFCVSLTFCLLFVWRRYPGLGGLLHHRLLPAPYLALGRPIPC